MKCLIFITVLALFISLQCFGKEISVKDLGWTSGRDDSREAHLKLIPVEKRDETAKLMQDFKEVDITAADGITLKAIVLEPAADSSNGKNPLVIFISSWGLNKWEYIIPAREMADRGYTVVSYTARGFWGSGGEINLAGPLDMADISTIIDWSLANTNGDLNRIGLSGISYGAGMSILGTAFDTRIRTATAMSCWIDLAQSLLGNGETIRQEAVSMLKLAAEMLGTPSAELNTLFDDYFSNTNLPYMYEYTKNSSAMTYLDIINEHQPNIFIANAYQDSLFTPNQFPAFYNALKGNKHIEFSRGDHAGPEMLGLFGLPDAVWNRAYDWMDYYVRDAHTDQMSSMPMVMYTTMYTKDEVDGYDSLEEVTNAFASYSLTKNEGLMKTTASVVEDDLKKIAVSAQRDETVGKLTTGAGGNINGGIAYVTATVRAIVEKPVHFNISAIDRTHACVFQTDRLTSALKFRGNGQLTLHFVPKTAATGSFIVYFLDVDPLTKEGRLITFTPWTFKDAVPGQVNTLTMALTTFAYDMPTRNQLTMVISTHDPLFLDQAPADEEIDFMSGSILSLPLHQ